MPRRSHLVLTVAIVQSAVIVGLFAGSAWFLVGTDTGRTWVESRVEKELRSRYRSGEGATLAGLSLLPLGTLSLDAVVLRDSAGDPVVSSGRIEVKLALQPLLNRELHITQLNVDRLRANLDQDSTGIWNIERVMQLGLRDTVEKPREPTGWRVKIDSVALTNSSVVITQPDTAGGPRPMRRLFTGLDVRLGETLIDPDRERTSVVLKAFSVASSDPPLVVRNASGRVRVVGDTVSVDLPSVSLAHTRAAVRGTVRLRKNADPLIALSVRADRVDFAELQWANPLLPSEGEARATVAVNTGRAPGWMRYAITGLDVTSGASRANGRLIAELGPTENDIEIRNVDLTLAPLEIALIREMFGDSVPPPPFAGAISGRVRATGGPLSGFVLDSAELEFEDRRAGGARARFVVSGALDVQSADAVLSPMFVRIDSMPVQTAGAIVDVADSLRGYLHGSLRLDGPVNNLRFSELDLWHRDGALPPTHVRGAGRIADDESTTWMEADLALDEVGVAALGHPFTDEQLAGSVSGRLETRITGDSVWMDLVLRGERATMEFVGATTLDTSRLVAKGELRLQQFDGRRFLPEAGLPQHTVTAVAELGIDGPWDAPSGPVIATIDPSSVIGDYSFGTARTSFVLEPGGVRVDTLQLDGPLGRVSARGRLSRDPTLRDTLRFVASVDSLVQLRGFLPDSLASQWADSLGGSLHATGIAVGSFDTLDVRAELTGDRLTAGSNSVRRLTADLLLDGVPLATRGLATFQADSLIVGGLPITHIEGEATVREPAWADASMRLVAGDTLTASLRADIHFMGDSLSVRLDSLEARTQDAQWSLDRPASLFNGPGRVAVEGLELRSTDGAGLVVDAAVLSGGLLDVQVSASRIPLTHGRFTGLMPPRIGGLVSFDVTLVGSQQAPEITFTADLDSVQVDDRAAPPLRASGRYTDRLASVTLVTPIDQRDALRLAADLPLDLAFDDRAVSDRLIEAPLYIRFNADAAPLSALAAFTPDVRDLAGGFDADVQVTGTWENLVPRGLLLVRDGAFAVPALGTGFEDLLFDLSLAPDSIIIHRFRLAGERAANDSASIEGAIVRQNSRWHADIRTVARNLRVIDDPRVAEADVSWTLRLRGPLDTLVLGGDVAMPVGNLFIGRPERHVLVLDEEVEESIDPMAYAPRIDALRVRLGNEVRLRSPEANVQLTGTVDVTGTVSEPDVRGEIIATRGTYRLDLGLLQRTFQVDSGRVRVNGPLSEPATLNIHTSYTVRQADKEDVKIGARLTGTVDEPRLQLSSGDLGTTASDTEIISYLLFGAPTFALDGQSSSAVRLATSALVPSLGGAAERALGARIPFLSELQVTTVANETREFTLNSFEGLLNSFALTAGTQIGTDSYLRVSGGVCSSTRAAETLPAWLGVTAEYRPREKVSAELSLTPGSSPCNRVGNWTQIYQFGLDLFRDWRW